MDRYDFWLKNAPTKIVDKIRNFSVDDRELYFGKDLNFGTAGLRGKILWGTNSINDYTIAKATYSFGKWLLNTYAADATKYGIVVAHDNRRFGVHYSLIVASVLAEMKIPVFLFKENQPCPTPLLSYTVVNNKFVGGINITASHNPPSDSGFKVYDALGKQLANKETTKIQEISNGVENIFTIPRLENKEQYLDESYFDNYLDRIKKEIPFIKIPTKKDLKIVFCANNGTAAKFARPLLDFSRVEYEFVKEQEYPDENFTNTPHPNPQDIESYDLAKVYGDKSDADLIFATDPDADRFGIMIKHQGKWVDLSGNQLPLIQIKYKLEQLNKRGLIEKNDFIVRSVVTSHAADKIAKQYKVNALEAYTGFKNLMYVVDRQQLKGNQCLFAWEEAYGSTVMPFTKDKDSFQALVQVLELIDYYKRQGKTLFDVLTEIFNEINFFLMEANPKRFSGASAMDEMKKIINHYRNNLKIGEDINGHKITEIRDYLIGYKDWPADNTIIIFFDDKDFVAIRPSGTEPLLRMYFDVQEKDKATAKKTKKELLAYFS